VRVGAVDAVAGGVAARDVAGVELRFVVEVAAELERLVVEDDRRAGCDRRAVDADPAASGRGDA
jgi:hypothetical protein